MSIFEDKQVEPMLIGVEGEPFDSDDYFYELKLDGERCIAFLDKSCTELRNKRNKKMLPHVPELSSIHECVNEKCILDGELIVIKDGKPDFYEIQRRSLMSNPLKIKIASEKYPACFTAYDILYYKDKPVMDLPLTKRKKLLQKAVKKETPLFAVSRVVEKKGTALFELTKQQDLEGVVAKLKDSKYYLGKRTKDWIKIKNLIDEDFVVCGYIKKEKGIISLVLGQYRDGELVSKGHVTLGVSSGIFKTIEKLKKAEAPFEEDDRTVWVKPVLVCTVKYMMKTNSGGMRQPVLKGLRYDKLPEECVER